MVDLRDSAMVEPWLNRMVYHTQKNHSLTMVFQPWLNLGSWRGSTMGKSRRSTVQLNHVVNHGSTAWWTVVNRGSLKV